MRRVTFQSVLWGAARQVGLAPETDGLDLPIAAQLTESINAVMKLAWEYYDWPQLVQTLDLDVVTLSSGAKYCPDEIDGIAQFGAIFAAWDADPRYRASKVCYKIAYDGVYLPCYTGDTVWLEHRPEAPRFTADVQTARNYQPGEVVYVPSTGECYVMPATPYEWLADGEWTEGTFWLAATTGFTLGLDGDGLPVLTGGTGDTTLSQTVAALPAGSYRLNVVVPALLGEAGVTGLVLKIRAGGVLLATLTGPTDADGTAVTFPHAGGSCLIEVRAEWVGDGQIYAAVTAISLIPNPAGTSPSAPALPWQRVDFPAFLAEAVKAGAAAGFHRVEGQAGSALTIEAIMVSWLDHEITQLLQQGQTKTYRH